VIKHILRYGLAAFIACGILLAPLFARADDNKEYLVKAAFIYNFVKFIQWPGDLAIGKKTNIDVCVVGDGPLLSTINVFKAASTAKLSLSLVEEKNWRNAPSHCHILFIGDSEEGNVAEIVAGLKGQPILTVSDIDHFAENGGMIGFTTSDNKIKLIVNTRSTAAAGMKVDAQLLEIALKVIGGGGA
jgi:hypothetical protein